MRVDSTFRVMWLLNHSAARKFEVPMLKRIGINEIYTPKIYPSDIGFRSASIDFTEDSNLTIPRNIVDRLNEINWYETATASDWQLASQYFDVCFFILINSEILKIASQNFDGMMLWRTYGLDQTVNYSSILKFFCNGYGEKWINKLGRRFIFAQAYSHLSEIEPNWLSSRAVYLPLGMHSVEVKDEWSGNDPRILFVCPDIGFNTYYQKIYKNFLRDFGDLPHVIGGAQPLAVNDPNVLGFLPAPAHEKNMKELRVMFYHSQEPNHIHYHPFEAIRAGMPLVFMADGMLDRMGGQGLPGCCKTIAEARDKIERILAGDQVLIKQIRHSQIGLLEPMRPSNCEPAWREGFGLITKVLDQIRLEQSARPKKQYSKRIAIILPVTYRGGSLRGSFVLAQALYFGSREYREDAEISLFHLDDEKEYSDSIFDELPSYITRRSFKWKILSAAEARRAMRYAGHIDWTPTADNYIVPNDGINYVLDCDLWLVISDRLSYPILPIKPITLMVYDYLQRYVNLLSHGADQAFLMAARSAELVLVTTEFSRQDALQYAGLESSKVKKLPMLAPAFTIQKSSIENTKEKPYFIWSTNAAIHKNHARAAEALRIYYEELDGQWSCRVTGVNTYDMLNNEAPYLQEMAKIFNKSKLLKKRVKWLGELPETLYQRLLSNAALLWHPALIDNGTFSVIEAACFGVPALSSDYPAMNEINEQFSLNLAWMNPNNSRQMATQLKSMEDSIPHRRNNLPSTDKLLAQRAEAHAQIYWKEVRTCL